jgi:pseudouridine synthase
MIAAMNTASIARQKRFFVRDFIVFSSITTIAVTIAVYSYIILFSAMFVKRTLGFTIELEIRFTYSKHMLIRLNKYIAEAGICSRRKADELISLSKVSVNGKVVAELGTQIDPEKDEIKVDGQLCQINQKTVYYALYKPIGVISTANDEKGRANVTSLVPKTPRVYPIGRLDMYSEGLIILTNDGELAQRLTHPSFEHEKEYEIKVRSHKSEVVSQGEIKKKFERGLLIDNVLMKAYKVQLLTTHDPQLMTIRLVLHTGHNRQIRRMCDKIGLQVAKLTRIRIGKLRLADLNLKPGQYKEIKKNQII